MANKFIVTQKHGRVFKRVDAYTRVLVAIPGQEIPIELARECGLLDEPEPEPKELPVKKEHGKQPPATQSYPTKTHKA